MPRDLPIGNGQMLIAFDKSSLLREFHFPYVGQENHVGAPFQFGIFVHGKCHWIPHGWKIKRDYLDDTLVTNVELINETLKLQISIHDLVDFTSNLYLKNIKVKNLEKSNQEIKLFFYHHFNIYGNEIGNTAVFKPENQSLLHYKGERYFLINVLANHKYGIDLFATGDVDSWKDAEDGLLSGNPIAQGNVSSVIGIPLSLQPESEEECFYWIAVGKDWDEVKLLDHKLQKTTPKIYLKRTADYWKCWVNKENLNPDLLPPKLFKLYKRSLLICRTQMNNCGSIIAGNDSDVIQFNRDTYSYMWPRDAAIVAYGLNLAGYDTPDFYRFLGRCIEKEGYFQHKYQPSGSLGSSWHPWFQDQKPQLPIQEDETALVLWALWKHYLRFKDLELIRPLYAPLIKKAADFLMDYIDPKTNLPLPSYDLWEERQGILTFTVSTVYGALMAASCFAKIFGEDELEKEYAEGAKNIRNAMDQYLYLPDQKRFARMIRIQKDGLIHIDATVDASLYATFAFGAYSPEDEKVVQTMDQILQKLRVAGGIIRYENDPFYRTYEESNPWFVTTLWTAQYFIAKAKTKEDLKLALSPLEWVADHALESGALAEQLNPRTLEPVSVSPLTWSHGTYVVAIQEYLNQLLKLNLCQECGMPKVSKLRC